MSDRLSAEQRHIIMASIRSFDTRPELLLRRFLWHDGFRYLVNDKRLPGKPDIVLPKYRTVIFVHGCFWHGHKGCKNHTIPKTNAEFWMNKITRNQERDQRAWRQLEAKNWSVIIVWECELEKRRFDETASRVEKEIVDNGREYQKRMNERRWNRQQRLLERKKESIRNKQMMEEILRWKDPLNYLDERHHTSH